MKDWVEAITGPDPSHCTEEAMGGGKWSDLLRLCDERYPMGEFFVEAYDGEGSVVLSGGDRLLRRVVRGEV